MVVVVAMAVGASSTQPQKPHLDKFKATLRFLVLCLCCISTGHDVVQFPASLLVISKFMCAALYL